MSRSREASGRRRKCRLALILSTMLLAAVVVPSAASASPSSNVVISSFSGSIGLPNAIVPGPDGALWFTNLANVGRITTNGAITEYTDPGINSTSGIAVGPDGAIWFYMNGAVNGSIGRMTTAGVVTNIYSDPRIVHNAIVAGSIAVGSDGALWFTNYGNPFQPGSIGRITTDGAISVYTDPAINHPLSIAAGPDGALWFTTPGWVGRITTSGSVTQYETLGAGPWVDIVAGPDGAMWFTGDNDGFPSIGRITMDGTVTDYDGGGLVTSPTGIAVGPDGALWIVEQLAIGRMTTNGSFTNYEDLHLGNPGPIASGPDAALWFGNTSNNSIDRIAFAQPTVVPFGGVVSEGTAGTSELDLTVTLSHPFLQPVTAQWNSIFIAGASNVQALPDTDYIPASGTVTFPPGATTETVPITVVNHDLGMPYKLLVVSFHNPTNAGMGGYWGLGFGFLVNNSP